MVAFLLHAGICAKYKLILENIHVEDLTGYYKFTTQLTLSHFVLFMKHIFLL